MTDKEKSSKQIKISNLSKKSQAKLKEIKQKQGLRTDEEAIEYLTSFFAKK